MAGMTSDENALYVGYVDETFRLVEADSGTSGSPQERLIRGPKAFLQYVDIH